MLKSSISLAIPSPSPAKAPQAAEFLAPLCEEYPVITETTPYGDWEHIVLRSGQTMWVNYNAKVISELQPTDLPVAPRQCSIIGLEL